MLAEKLQPYRKEISNLPAQPQGRRKSSAHNGMWADNILGLGTTQPLAHGRSLVAEVDAYLLDAQAGTSSVNFWQV